MFVFNILVCATVFVVTAVTVVAIAAAVADVCLSVSH